MNNVERPTGEAIPDENWERIPGESGAAFAAFSAYRDFGPERTIRKAVDRAFKNNLDEPGRRKRCLVWKQWSCRHLWLKRAEGYDSYVRKLAQAQLRKNIEEREKLHKEATGKLLQAAIKKLASIDPCEITQNAVGDWIRIAIKADLEIDQFTAALYPESQESQNPA